MSTPHIHRRSQSNNVIDPSSDNIPTPSPVNVSFHGRDGSLHAGNASTEVDPPILDGFEDAITRLITDLFPDYEAVTYVARAYHQAAGLE